MRRAPAGPVRACFVRSCCSVIVQEHGLRRDPGAMQLQANTFFTLDSALFTPRPPHFTLALHLNSSHLSSSHLISCLLICRLSSSWLSSMSSQHSPAFHISSKLVSTHLGSSARPSTTSYHKACAEYFPVLLCTTKLAQSTSQYYFLLQSLHKALPSTTLCYKACTKHFPVLLCTTKLAPSTTLYYKACTKHVPVLLCTTKLAQSTFQYYFVLQTLHKVRPSTTLYVPVLLCTTKLAQRKLLHTASSFAEKLYTQQAF